MTDEKQREIFSKNLRFYLESARKNQLEVARAIGVSPQTFNTWCQGKALPRMGRVQQLADYFRISKTDLIDERKTTELTLTVSQDEMFLIQDFRRLDDSDKDRVHERIQTFLESDKYKKESSRAAM